MIVFYFKKMDEKLEQLQLEYRMFDTLIKSLNKRMDECEMIQNSIFKKLNETGQDYQYIVKSFNSMQKQIKNLEQKK